MPLRACLVSMTTLVGASAEREQRGLLCWRRASWPYSDRGQRVRPRYQFLRGRTGLRSRGGLPGPDERRAPQAVGSVRPPGATTGLPLARADGEGRAGIVGKQAAGRVGFFLHVEDFDAAYARMASAGVQFLTAPRTEPYGRVAVFVDIAGNKWDLIGPAA